MKGRNIFFIIIIIIVIILIIYDCLKSPVERYILTKKLNSHIVIYINIKVLYETSIL